MSLQTKFALLLAALSAAVLLALGTAWWALGVTYREVREPVRTSSRALALLVNIEHTIDELRGLAHPGEAFSTRPAPLHDGLTIENYRARAQLLEQRFADLLNERAWSEYAGRSPVRNLKAKLDQFHASAEAHFLLDDSAERDKSLGRIGNQLFDIHELLKRVEGRIVADIRDLADSSADLRTRLFVVLTLALLLVMLMGGLATALVRRWVVRPVGLLRAAAARIAAGDFEHRVPIADNAPGDEMTALSAEVNHMAGMVKHLQAERIEQERLAAIGEMVRRLAHNLRNPLSGIRNLAELTRSEVAPLGASAADVRENQDRIISTVDRFESWLRDLLKVTKPTQVEVADHEVRQWLTGLVEAHRPMAEGLGVQLTLDVASGPLRANFDPRHLEQAVSAILSNAIEAAKQNQSLSKQSQVRVRSFVPEPPEAASHWELSIADSGPGVPEHLRSSVFKPYFTTKKDGNGIGLAMAFQVVRGHGGEIRIDDSPNAPHGSGEPVSGVASPIQGGAIFTVRLPLANRQAEDEQSLANIGQQGATIGSDPGH